MADTPTDAPAPAPTGESVTPTPTNTEPTQAPTQASAPDMHGFTSDELADIRKFFDNSGGFDAVKSKISNPEPRPAEPVQPAQTSEPTSQPQAPVEPETPKTPAGAITAQEFLAEQYFKSLSGEEKYANIADGIRNGDYLKEMSAFGINALNADGSINDQKVRMYLDLKAQTVPAKPTETEPNDSAAPTVTYTEVGDKIESLDQAYKVIMEPNHPRAKDAEEFIKNSLNKK